MVVDLLCEFIFMSKRKPNYSGKGKNTVKPTPLYTIIEEDENDLKADNQEVIHLEHLPSINTILPDLYINNSHDHPPDNNLQLVGRDYGCCVIS